MSDAIAFKNVSKSFRKGEKAGSLRDALPKLLNILNKNTKNRKKDLFWALDNINLNVEKGETLGIIGPNGAGKTTILKLISGILKPNNGQTTVKGRISSLIEIGAGFHPDLTGRENIYLNGSIMGMSRREIKEKFDSIVDFAGIAEFIDTPVKRYSSGMYVRLGFSVAIHTDPDILLVDEVLAVGDEIFQRKSIDKMCELKDQGKTIIFISHNLDLVGRFCENSVYLSGAKIRAQGSSGQVIKSYLADVRKERAQASKDSVFKETMKFGSGQIVIDDVAFYDRSFRKNPVFRTDEYLKVCVKYTSAVEIPEAVFGIAIHSADGILINGTNTSFYKMPLSLCRGSGEISYELERILLRKGAYFMTVAFYDKDRFRPFVQHEQMYEFEVDNGSILDTGFIFMPCMWNKKEQR